MKKPVISILILLSLLLIVFVLGFYLGRSTTVSEITISQLPEATADETSPTAIPEDSLVNINTAGPYELMSLPGIGETLAQRILTYRDTNGPFPDADGLLNVEGIGRKTLESILDYITTGG